jgi:hypothetical protein
MDLQVGVSSFGSNGSGRAGEKSLSRIAGPWSRETRGVVCGHSDAGGKVKTEVSR